MAAPRYESSRQSLAQGGSRGRCGSRGGRGFIAALARKKPAAASTTTAAAMPIHLPAPPLAWGGAMCPWTTPVPWPALGALRLAKRLVFRLRLANAEAANRLVDKLVGLAFVQCEERDVLDAGELVFHRLRDVALLEVNRQDDLLAFTGEGEFLDDVFGTGRVSADGEDEKEEARMASTISLVHIVAP